MKRPCDGCRYYWRTRREHMSPVEFCGTFRRDIPPDLIECNAYAPKTYTQCDMPMPYLHAIDVDPRPVPQAEQYL